MMLQQKAIGSVAGRNLRVSRKASVVVRCQAKPVEPVKQAVAALAAASILLSPAAAFARLPEGVKAPSTQSEPFELYEKLIEQRTGKAEALPELNEAPQGTVSIKTTYAEKPLVAGAEAETSRPSLPVAPLVPDVAPPAPAPVAETPAPAVVEAPAAVSATAAATTEGPKEVSPIRAAAIADAEKSAAAAAPAAAAATAPAPSPVALAGGLVGVVAVAAIVLGGNKGEEAPAAPAAPAATESPEATAEGATAAATAASDASDKAL